MLHINKYKKMFWIKHLLTYYVLTRQVQWVRVKVQNINLHIITNNKIYKTCTNLYHLSNVFTTLHNYLQLHVLNFNINRIYVHIWIHSYIKYKIYLHLWTWSPTDFKQRREIFRSFAAERIVTPSSVWIAITRSSGRRLTPFLKIITCTAQRTWIWNSSSRCAIL